MILTKSDSSGSFDESENPTRDAGTIPGEPFSDFVVSTVVAKFVMPVAQFVIHVILVFISLTSRKLDISVTQENAVEKRSLVLTTVNLCGHSTQRFRGSTSMVCLHLWKTFACTLTDQRIGFCLASFCVLASVIDVDDIGSTLTFTQVFPQFGFYPGP